VSDWVRHAIWWQVYPLGFTGAEPLALSDGTEPVLRIYAEARSRTQVEELLTQGVKMSDAARGNGTSSI